MTARAADGNHRRAVESRFALMSGVGRARRVAVVQHQRVAVGVAEERHVADPGVEDVAAELDAALLEHRARGRDVVDVQREEVRVGLEVADAHALGVDHVEGDRAGLELREVALGAVDRARQAERLAVEGDCALEVARGDGDEVDAGDDRGGPGGAHGATISGASRRPRRLSWPFDRHHAMSRRRGIAPDARRRRLVLAFVAALALVLGVVAGASSGGGDGAPAPSATQGTTPDASSAAAPAAQRAAVDRLALEQQVGQLLVLRFTGTTVPDYVARALRERRAAGAILFADNVVDLAQTRALTAALRAAGGRPIVAVDQEGGAVRIVRWAPPVESAPAQGADGSAAMQARDGARAL